jgi:diguanylate cyclase (GGDEF)-like protein
MLEPLVAPDASPGKTASAEPSALQSTPAAHAPGATGQAGAEALLAVATGLLGCRSAMLWVAEPAGLRLVAGRGLPPGADAAGSALATLVGTDAPVAAVADASVDPRLRADPLVAARDGVRFYAAAALRAPGGRLVGVLGVGDAGAREPGDSLERLAPLAMLAERALVAGAPSRCRQAADASSSAILVVDPSGRTVFANAAARDLLGPAAMPGQPLDRLVPLALQADPDQVAHWLHGDGQSRDDVPSARQLRIRDATGELRLVDAVRCDWHDRDTRGVSLILHEVAEPGGAAREARAVRRDALTGLPTREALFATIDSLRRSGARLGVALLGLDNFRAVNEALGHEIGDAVLQVVACRLMAWLPQDAHLARFGGDEFAILFEAPNGVDGFEPRLHALLRDVARPCEVDHQRVHVEACIGLAFDGSLDASTQGEHGGNGLLALASLALHHAKRAGSLQLRRFSPSMRAEAIDRRHLDLELRRAFRDGEFELHYQPQIDLATGLPSGAEALLRWRHPERGLLMPVAFIDALARSAIAPAVGNWILQQACRDAASWPPAGGRRLKVGVNLFPAQFNDDALVDKVDAALAASGLAPEQLEIELTETIALREDGVAERTLGQLRRRGIRVSYDDFGTGHASLSMLHRLPVDRVKIDRSFVRDLVESRGDKAIVRSITLIARNFDMEVIAEGVESDEQAMLLREFGCHEVQGFLYSRALPRPVFDQWLAERTAARAAAVEPCHG